MVDLYGKHEESLTQTLGAAFAGTDAKFDGLQLLQEQVQRALGDVDDKVDAISASRHASTPVQEAFAVFPTQDVGEAVIRLDGKLIELRAPSGQGLDAISDFGHESTAEVTGAEPE
eukprot:2099853-Karenia_brevis.AAC.1